MIYCTVVLYNTKITESVTIKNILPLISNFDVKIYAIDNSINVEIISFNKLHADELDITYLAMEGNKGLSKAYNAFLDVYFAKNSTCEDIVIWLDDDTLITKEYFVELSKCLLNNKFDIFVPKIIGQDGIMWSPNEAGFLKNHLIRGRTDIIRYSKFNAINSCTAVRLSVLANYRYDERLFLDQVDHKFFQDQRQLNRSFFVLDVTIKQTFFQRAEELEPENIYGRLVIRFRDIITYGVIQSKYGYRALALTKCLGLSFELGFKARSIWLLVKSIILSLKYFFTISRN